MQNKIQRRLRRKQRRRIRAYTWFNRFLQLTLGVYLKARYNARAHNGGLLRRLTPPYLVMPNHTSFWDPFLVSAFVPDPVYYVTSDSNFRSWILNFLLGLVGAIPKTKVLSDFDTVRNILRIKQSKGVIGIFPEGRRSWDGKTLPIVPSTAKLVKLLKVPVVLVRMQGAYLSLPRWARSSRRGELTVSYELALTPEQISTTDAGEIYDRLCAGLEYDECEWMAPRNLAFKGRRRAERLEQLLYVCPDCSSLGKLASQGNRFRCLACGYTVRYEPDGRLTTANGTRRFENVRPWNEWQGTALINLLRSEHSRRAAAFPNAVSDVGDGSRVETRGGGEPPPGVQPEDIRPGVRPPDVRPEAETSPPAQSANPIVRKGHFTLSTGYRAEPLRRHPKGELCLFHDRLEYRYRLRGTGSARSGPAPVILRFPLASIEGANVQNNDRFEFYYEDVLYSFKSATGRGCGYMWLNAVVVLRAIGGGLDSDLVTLSDIHRLHYAAHSTGRSPVA